MRKRKNYDPSFRSSVALEAQKKKDELYKEIGKLQMEVDYLRKKILI